MQKLFLESKTGFSSLLPFKIFDCNGLLFYSDFFTTKIAKGERLKFNLPAGNYFYDGILERLPKPVEFEKIVLPKEERDLPYKVYKVEFGNNPNKCSIFYKEGRILFDTSLKSKPIYMKYNIYFHELGHHLYSTEKYADLFAAKKMLELGFNPSQIGLNSLVTLSPKNYDRKKFIINKIKKV